MFGFVLAVFLLRFLCCLPPRFWETPSRHCSQQPSEEGGRGVAAAKKKVFVFFWGFLLCFDFVATGGWVMTLGHSGVALSSCTLSLSLQLGLARVLCSGLQARTHTFTHTDIACPVAFTPQRNVSKHAACHSPQTQNLIVLQGWDFGQQVKALRLARQEHSECFGFRFLRNGRLRYTAAHTLSASCYFGFSHRHTYTHGGGKARGHSRLGLLCVHGSIPILWGGTVRSAFFFGCVFLGRGDNMGCRYWFSSSFGVASSGKRVEPLDYPSVTPLVLGVSSPLCLWWGGAQFRCFMAAFSSASTWDSPQHHQP